MFKRKSRRKVTTRHEQTARFSKLHGLSLTISALALTVIVLFLFPWLQGDEALSGLDVASRNLQITENFPSGVVFIVPLVVASILYQYYRRVLEPQRPRRRGLTAVMLIIGLVATGLWIRLYTINATEFLNQAEEAAALANTSLPTGNVDTPPSIAPPQTIPVHTTGEVLRERFTFELWLHLALAAALVFLPFLDTRPPVDPPVI